MKYEVRYKPAFATIFLTLLPGERITAESGAMASMAAELGMKTQFFGGLLPALMKGFFGGESLFVNVFSNKTQQPYEVVLTQSSIGDIAAIQLQGNELCLQPGAYIAHSGGVNVGVQWAGLASWFSGEGLFKLKVSGKGLVFFGAYGGLTEVDVIDDFVVDNSHLVAYEPTITMNVRLSGGLFGSVASGEGFVNRLKGKGKIYLQSRSMDGLVKFLRPKL
ncbi:MAG: TIGR00266 family protein [Cyanobacteria bacterium P01_E01_bin.6]